MGLTRRGRAVSAALGALTVLGGGVALRSALTVHKSAATPVTIESPTESPIESPTTPLFSARRTPEFWRAALAERRLQGGLRRAVAGQAACVVARVGGETIGAVEPELALAPASTMKLVTAFTVLRQRGANFTFATELRGSPADSQGVIAGDVHLVGGGDPTLSTPRYEEYVRASSRLRSDPLTPLQGMADFLVAAGITRIDGAVVGDGSRYSGPTFLPTWKPSYRAEGQVGPIGALTVNHGFSEFPPPLPVDDPALYAAEQLTTLLERAGIDVVAEPRSEVAPIGGGALLATLTSPPLDRIVAGMLTSSDNTTAEMLLREAALGAGEAPTTDSGIRVAIATLAEVQARSRGAAPLDGSGLSPGGRLACATLIDLVDAADPAIDDGYADAGESGTLALRFIGHPLQGVLHAKTGQINGVVGLAGFLDAEGARPLVRFAFLANGDFSTEGGQALQQVVAEALASYPDAPPTSELVPAPASVTRSE